MRSKKFKSKAGCVPVNKYKKTGDHVWTTRIRKKPKDSDEWGPWTVYCSWCGRKKGH